MVEPVFVYVPDHFLYNASTGFAGKEMTSGRYYDCPKKRSFACVVPLKAFISVAVMRNYAL